MDETKKSLLSRWHLRQSLKNTYGFLGPNQNLKDNQIQEMDCRYHKKLPCVQLVGYWIPLSKDRLILQLQNEERQSERAKVLEVLSYQGKNMGIQKQAFSWFVGLWCLECDSRVYGFMQKKNRFEVGFRLLCSVFRLFQILPLPSSKMVSRTQGVWTQRLELSVLFWLGCAMD